MPRPMYLSQDTWMSLALCQKYGNRHAKAQSTNRIPVEHGIGHIKNWQVLQRWTGPRDHLPDMILAVTGLVSDRTPVS